MGSRVAFVGTYPPRLCGIATFTHDLAAAYHGAADGPRPMTVALTEPGGQHDYPSEVEYEIDQGARGDYARAAEFVNFSDVRLVSVQHEHGIFGGEDGAYVLDFLGALRVPALVTLHTVLKHPSEGQRRVVQKIAQQCAGLVVMSRVAEALLASSYGIHGATVHVVPHGIPEMRPRDQPSLKARFGVSDHRMLLTFGLLGPNKGIETVIRSLPAVIKRCPDVLYFVVGATHPAVVRSHGEEYRTMLEREAEQLGVRDHVVFRDQFVALPELCNYLQAADIFISPYQNEAQVTSGALTYAMGAGAAVVSTPYWHAQELLADGRGALFPFADSHALAEILVNLLESPARLREAGAAAHDFTRSFVWPSIGATYVDLASRLIAQSPRRAPHLDPPRASSLPELRLDHLLRLTDDTSIVQHATYSVPARDSGYCVDDTARALIVALGADRVHSSPETRRLITTYMSFLHHAQTRDGGFRNFMSYQRVFSPAQGSEDCLGRAVWALATAARSASDDGVRLLAREMFERAMPRLLDSGPRGTALAMLALTSYLEPDPQAAPARAQLEQLTRRLLQRYQDAASADWRWFEPTLTYDNALMPLALLNAFQLTGDARALHVARESLGFLEGVCFKDGQLVLVGNAGWHSRGGEKPVTDEQAIDAAMFVLAFRGAFLATHDHHYLRRMRQAFAWFLGANRLGLPLYDHATAGCHDGLGARELNLNQGAESTICFLLALLEMLELAGEGLEYAPRKNGVAPAVSASASPGASAGLEPQL